jgi:hypothetical protein
MIRTFRKSGRTLSPSKRLVPLVDEWRPRSREQYEAVCRLAVNNGGVLVRELPDGTAEVLAIRQGVCERRTVTADGFSIVMESQPTNAWRSLVGGSLGLGGMGALLGGFAAAFSGLEEPTRWLMGIGMAALFVAALVVPREKHYTKRGETWTALGYEGDGSGAD